MRKRSVVGRIHGMKYSSRDHKDRKRHKNRERGKKKKKSGQAGLVYVRHKPQHPHHVKVSLWGHRVSKLS